MAEYFNVTTNLGDAEVANAITNNTKIDITHIVFGDGNGSVPTPLKTRTALVREVHRQPVTKYERHKTNPNWIVIETIIPSNVGGFTVREIGVIGNGKLISHGNHAPFEKIADPNGVSEYRLKFTQNITDGNAVSITLDESLIFATQDWVEEKYIKRSEIVDNLTTDDSTKPVSARQAKILNEKMLTSIFLNNSPVSKLGQRQINVTYTNPSSTKYIFVGVSLAKAEGISYPEVPSVSINWMKFLSIYIYTGFNGQATFIVPPLAVYRISYEGPGDFIVTEWSEL